MALDHPIMILACWIIILHNAGAAPLQLAFTAKRAPESSTQRSSDISTTTATSQTARAFSILSIMLLVGLMLMFILGIWRLHNVQKKRRDLRFLEDTLQEDTSQMDKIDRDLPLNDQTDYLPYYVKFEIPRNRLVMGATLGKGCFGRVCRAELIGPNLTGKTTVAVKMLPDRADSAEHRAFIGEIKLMMYISDCPMHPNVIQFLGAVAKNCPNGQKMMLLEFCPRGSLLDYLRTVRDAKHYVSLVDEHGAVLAQDVQQINYACTRNASRFSQLGQEIPILSTLNLVSFAQQICDGMAHLHGLGVIHRDLAARNVLVVDENLVKIADFGLARQDISQNYQHKNKNARLPWRWIAVETVTKGVSTLHSDVWSFAILMWEMFSLGAQPYSRYGWDENFVQALSDGMRLGRPYQAPIKIWSLIQECWHAVPIQRPLFPELALRLASLESQMRTCTSSSIVALDAPEDEEYLNAGFLLP